MEFWLAIFVVLIAVISIIFRGKTRRGMKVNSRLSLLIGIIAAIIGLIGYVFLGWRF